SSTASARPTRRTCRASTPCRRRDRAMISTRMTAAEPMLRIVVEREGLARVAEATGALIAVSNAFRAGAVEHALGVSGLDEHALQRAWEPYRWGRRDLDPMLGAMRGGPFAVVTRRRAEVVADRAWYRSRLVGDFFRPLGMDDCIQSEVRLPGGVVHR